MSEAAILEKIETLNQTVARLQERVEELEDLRDLEATIAENAASRLFLGKKLKRNRSRIVGTCRRCPSRA